MLLYFFQRGVNVPKERPHHVLVELFYRYLLPLPQRTYRANRQGRALAYSQMRIDKRKKQDKQISNQLLEDAKKRLVAD